MFKRICYAAFGQLFLLDQLYANGVELVKLHPPYTVEIYSAIFCGYCERMKEDLEEIGIPYIEHGTIFSSDNYGEMLKRTNGEDGVPRLFINNHYIGGYREFNVIDSRKLDSLAKDIPISLHVKK